ncbi:MAG: hypothetical protein NC120_05515 [Ruminococcus sp.]|nr:hypothetical protein [Ruminococcus sp.]
MSYLNKKFNENEMMSALGELLVTGESIQAAVYCVFKPTGFFAHSSNIIAGYAAVTDRDRFICCKYGLITTETAAYDFEDMEKIEIKKNIFGQMMIAMVFENVKKNEVKIHIAPKVAGSGLPNQERNTEKMLEIFEAKQHKLQGV